MHPADRAILDHFRHTRERTIEVFRRVPDEILAHTTPAHADPIGAQFFHIAASIDWFMNTVMGDDRGEDYTMPRERAALVDRLIESGERPKAFFTADESRFDRDYSAAIGDGTTRTHSGRDWLMTIIDHEVHHRGQIVGALREKGMRFPIFRYS